MTINIEDIKPGDTVTLEHSAVGSVALPAEVPTLHSHVKVTIPGFGTKCIHDLIDRGWTVTDHNPKVELPTVPGFYVESERSTSLNEVWLLTGNGHWISAAGFVYDDRAEEFAPFTRLVPESSNRAQIAAEVIDWIEATLGYQNLNVSILTAARQHFGVEVAK